MTLFEREPAIHDQDLRQAIKNGDIKIDPFPVDSQFQPASLDITVGAVEIYSKNNTFVEQTYLDKKDQPILISKGKTAKITFHERIMIKRHWDGFPKYQMTFALRSSRGRLHLNDLTYYLDEKGPQSVMIRNDSPNDIILYGHDPFGQVLFRPTFFVKTHGSSVHNISEVQKLASICLDGWHNLDGPAVEFTFQKKCLRMRTIGTIDTRKKYSESDLYEEVDLSSLNSNSFFGVGSYIVKLYPSVKMPSDVGLRLFGKYIKAEWVDPGYIGAITAQPTDSGVNLLLGDDRIIKGIFYKYATPVARPYGSKEINSHYQNSSGSGSRS